ncbi:probable receptor-like protein kinase At1g49730 isoform X1 [Rhododendron vialii]|uniref:probable receptor-like protein kinase At1g49730 isoform X1 n=1 Tax=Rhododendron vialii TaxID=182163 RepID=UPI00265F2EE2|nr:probable receptor-like protein kinase At1g49730 isoform X1 [Rhododendron vialii]
MDHLLLKIRLLLLSWFHLHPSPPGTICFARHFSYRDIKKATDGFRRIIDNSHGATYKAKFQDGSVAMVKEIRDFDEEAFYKEVLLLGCLHHRHIVSLCGFSTGRKRFLVFENIENGTLKDHLNDPLKTPLNWRTRLHIVIGVAAALEYLYFFCNPPMYHVSVSSSTILLDENYNAKLCNIGILGSRPNNVTLPQSSCTKECDDQECGNVIFQLGLLILELITGQSSEDGGAELIQWVQEYRFSKTVHKVLDPDLGDNYDSRELKGLLAVARLCTKSVDKPTAFTPQVFRYLQKKIGIAVA